MVLVELSGLSWSARCLFLVCSPPVSLVAHRDGRRRLRNRIGSVGLVKHPGIRIISRASGYSTGGRLINRPGYASVRNIYNVMYTALYAIYMHDAQNRVAVRYTPARSCPCRCVRKPRRAIPSAILGEDSILPSFFTATLPSFH